MQIFNNIFSSIVAKLNIAKYEDLSLNSAKSEDPLENLITKHKNHPSIRAILDKSPTSFSLKTFSKKDIEKEILNLNVVKASQDSDIPTIIIKKDSDIFSNILFKEFNKSLEICKFPSCLKMGSVTPVYKKGIDLTKSTIAQSVFYQICQKFLKGDFVNTFLHFLRTSFLSINAGFRFTRMTKASMISKIETALKNVTVRKERLEDWQEDKYETKSF